MTAHPNDYITPVIVQEIEDRVDRMLLGASSSDFRGYVGQHFEGHPDSQEAYEFAKRLNDKDYDVFLLVRVRA